MQKGSPLYKLLLVSLLNYWRESKLIFQQWRNSHAPVGPSYQAFRTQFSTWMVPPSSADIVHNLYKHSLLVVTTKEGTLPASRRQKPEMPHPILAARDSLLKQTVQPNMVIVLRSRSSELKEKKPLTLTSTIGLSKDKACSKENPKLISHGPLPGEVKGWRHTCGQVETEGLSLSHT